ncbi:hypothetical protein B0H17DRAFT_1148602 [Mycena rosella]|uniref:Uncharacterized protein n=1 Tax=Mycena rosella TaxID=1033263 RepID=A0AAD7FTY0_MYCRO|nr:hypothetical protein B0H17DRAFT_1148602 [Mycena rosella]
MPALIPSTDVPYHPHGKDMLKQRVLGHSGYSALLWPTGASGPAWVTVPVVEHPSMGCWSSLGLGSQPARIRQRSVYVEDGHHFAWSRFMARTFTLLFAEQDGSSSSSCAHPENASPSMARQYFGSGLNRGCAPVSGLTNQEKGMARVVCLFGPGPHVGHGIRNPVCLDVGQFARGTPYRLVRRAMEPNTAARSRNRVRHS